MVPLKPFYSFVWHGPHKIPSVLPVEDCNSPLSLWLKAFTTKEIIGFSIGSISSLLYLCSRLPQMYTNVSPAHTPPEEISPLALTLNTVYNDAHKWAFFFIVKQG
jgi:hypothetical protein